MTIQGVWMTPDNYRVYEVETQREENFFIPGTDLLETMELQELVAALNEKAEVVFRAPEKTKMTRDQQHDLGGVMLQIRKSKRYKKDNGGHGRFWLGVK